MIIVGNHHKKYSQTCYKVVMTIVLYGYKFQEQLDRELFLLPLFKMNTNFVIIMKDLHYVPLP